jgi:uncharacterized OsmC-like protein
MSEQITVHYQQVGPDGHHLGMTSPFLADIDLDYTGASLEKRAGTATRLLCASALYCYAGSLQMALANRGAHIRSLTGKAVADEGKDDRGQLRVNKISIEMVVDVPPEERQLLEHCKMLVRDGCKITASVDRGIPVEYQITAAA